MAGVMSILRQSSPLVMVAGRPNIIRAFHTSLAKQSGGHETKTMVIQPSRWQWHKFKDMMHFYVMLGVIPLSLVTFFANIFVGPAKLTPIPEGYWPENQEYYQNPVTRFIVKYLHNNYQQDYEKKLHIHHVHEEIKQMKLLENRVRQVIAEREDVKGFSYTPIISKYHKHIREDYDNSIHTHGDMYD